MGLIINTKGREYVAVRNPHKPVDVWHLADSIVLDAEMTDGRDIQVRITAKSVWHVMEELATHPEIRKLFKDEFLEGIDRARKLRRGIGEPLVE